MGYILALHRERKIKSRDDRECIIIPMPALFSTPAVAARQVGQWPRAHKIHEATSELFYNWNYNEKYRLKPLLRQRVVYLFLVNFSCFWTPLNMISEIMNNHDYNHHHFICPKKQQYAHLHQYNLEEQDSEVRQEHWQLP